MIGERWLARPRDARSLGGTVCCEYVLSAKAKGRLGGAKVSIMRSVSVHVWVDALLTARVTLNMMAFDGREVGRSAKSFEVQHVLSTHRLSAKGSRDSSLHVESTRAWRFCGCVRGRATPGPSNARDNAFGWASGWFIYDISIIYI